jgi:hypothetical protein
MNDNFALLAITLPVLLMVGFGNISIDGSYTWPEHTSNVASPKAATLLHK